MGIFKKLFTPSIPDISNIVGVVEWFFEHDEKIKDVKESVPEPHLSNLKLLIIEHLTQSQTAASLQEDINDAATMHSSSLEILKAYAMLGESGMRAIVDIDANVSDDDAIDLITKNIIIEASSSAQLRIYGYFMVKKFNTQPT